jgi:hypothetical protein
MVRARSLILVPVMLTLGWAGESPARLYQNARKAYQKNDFIQAYALASEAAALAPGRLEYRSFANTVRMRSMLGAKAETSTVVDQGGGVSTISPAELREARQLLAPPVLRGLDGRRDFELRGDTRQLFDGVSKAFGLKVIFDRDLLAGAQAAFHLEQAGWPESLHALEALTSTFIVPVNEHVFLVAKDTAQKRAELEPVVSILLDYPEPLTPQEVQESARAVQTTFDITKMGIDNALHVVLFRDRVSRITPAAALFRQLTEHRAQIVTDIEVLLISQTSSIAYGLGLQTTYPLVFTGGLVAPVGTTYTAPTGYWAPLPSFGGGRTAMGLGISDTDMLATMSRGQTRSLLKAQLAGVDGQAAQLRVGDRYPIITSKYSNSTASTSAYATAPSVNFEDLGLTLKLTSRVHSSESVSLEVEAEMKALGSEILDDIPIISSRKLVTRVRATFGQTAILAGLFQQNISRSASGLPLFSLFSGTRDNTGSADQTHLLITLTPHLVSPPPGELPSPAIRAGTESRALTPLD